MPGHFEVEGYESITGPTLPAFAAISGYYIRMLTVPGNACSGWYKAQKDVCHCLLVSTIHNLADDPNQDASSQANAG